MRTLSKTYMAACLASLLLLAGCAGSETPDLPAPSPTEGKVAVTIPVDLTGAEDLTVETRAGVSDTDILTADGLLFDENGKFLEVLPAAMIEKSDDGLVHITLLFDAVTKRRTVHLIANSRDFASNAYRVDIPSLAVGDPESKVGQLKTLPLADGSNTQDGIPPCIMWGRFVLNNGITVNNTFPSTVNLLRSCAGITIKTAAGTPDNGLSDFVLEGASLAGIPTTGYLTPTASVTSAPTATPTAGRPLTTDIVTDGTRSMVEGSTVNLYAYERQCSQTDYMAVIIKGSYKGESGYYKLIIINGTTPYNIIRNHRYNITITKVNGRGYADMATAIASLPSNALRASFLDQNPDYSSVTADSQYKMSMDCNTFELYGKYSSTDDIIRLPIAKVEYTRGTTPAIDYTGTPAWISDVQAVSTGSNTYSVVASFHSDGQPHELDMRVKCDNLDLPLKVKWKPVDAHATGTGCYSVSLINAGEKNWSVRVVSGQTNPAWFGLNNSGAATGVTSTGLFVNQIDSRFDPGAYLHVNSGSTNIARLHKTCGTSSEEPVSANIAVIRHN